MVIELSTLGLFALSAAVLTLIPGADMLCALSNLITHDPQPASRADMASEGLPRLHAPIQPTCF
ncbi:hypothetical protein CAK78_02350 [Aeromonas sp. A35_P]|nr:hypothetical protein CAK78_02350 [Aeromonas sp. A35_P]